MANVKCGACGVKHSRKLMATCLAHELIDLAHRLLKMQIMDVREAARIMRCMADDIQRADH
jgi:hypothetical protein